jgi:ParB family chromosome partitioning protein
MKVHPIADLFPMLNESDLADLAADIKTNGLQIPLVKLGDVLIDGRNRMEACRIANVEPTFVEYQGGNIPAYIISANLHRRHLTESQRAMVAAGLANIKHGDVGGGHERQSGKLAGLVSQPEAAKLLNVSDRSVRDAALIRRESPELAAQVASGETTVHAAKEILRPHVSHNSGNNEWYTPRAIIEAARKVMGGIDCDPATSELANKTVKAETTFTAESDGLAISNKWRGNVWLNPPYAQPLIDRFSEQVTARYVMGQIKQACVLVNNATETEWFQRMLKESTAVCFLKSRVKFIDTDGNPGAPLQGQVLLYFGKHGKRFAEEFAGYGIIAEIVR